MGDHGSNPTPLGLGTFLVYTSDNTTVYDSVSTYDFSNREEAALPSASFYWSNLLHGTSLERF